MASDGEIVSKDSKSQSEESILQKHRVERKKLQAEIQSLKHAVPKGDKKKKKQVTAQIAQLEADLDAQHEKELTEFQSSQKEMGHLANNIDKLQMEGQKNEDQRNTDLPTKKLSKAERRREKKQQQTREREEKIQEQEAENLFGVRNVEAQAVKALLKKRGLQMYEVPSDGDCLYSAVVHQLKTRNIETCVTNLRSQTARHIRQHAENFLPFLCQPDTGDPYTPDEFNKYCDRIENTPEWGGQLEIQALSLDLSLPFEVIQADAPSIIVGEQFDAEPIILALIKNNRLIPYIGFADSFYRGWPLDRVKYEWLHYYQVMNELRYLRHAYRLGEHYNSVAAWVTETEDECS